MARRRKRKIGGPRTPGTRQISAAAANALFVFVRARPDSVVCRLRVHDLIRVILHGARALLDGLKLIGAGGSGFGIVLLIAIFKTFLFESVLKPQRPDSYAARRVSDACRPHRLRYRPVLPGRACGAKSDNNKMNLSSLITDVFARPPSTESFFRFALPHVRSSLENGHSSA